MSSSRERQNFILHKETADPSAVPVPRKEIIRYLGYRNVLPSEEVTSRMETCVSQMIARSRPAAVWTVLPVCHRDRDILEIGSLPVHSRSLMRNLSGCDSAAMMAATIGPGIDFLIRRSESLSMVDAAILQAAGAAYVEAWCDEVNSRINREMAQKGYQTRPRFSPGYGDLPLSLQKDFSRILDMPKNCGISLTDTLLMTPSKSVTAFIGFCREPSPKDSYPSGCAACGSAGSCEYRI